MGSRCSSLRFGFGLSPFKMKWGENRKLRAGKKTRKQREVLRTSLAYLRPGPCGGEVKQSATERSAD